MPSRATDLTSNRDSSASGEEQGGTSSGVGICFSIEPDGQRAFLYAEGDLQALLRLASEEVMAEPDLFFDLIHCDDRGPFEDLLDESRRGLLPIDHRFWQYTREGDLRRMHLRMQVRKNEKGGVTWEGLQSDITEGKSLDAIRYSIPANPSGPVRRSRLDHVDVPSILKELERLFEKERAYLDEDICLEELGRRLRVTPHALSELLNRRLGVTYYEYVSRWRVAEACRLLCELPDRTILQVGFESGFRSKVAFHEAFRRFTNLSPGEYRRRCCPEEKGDLRKDLVVHVSDGTRA